jgi:hypothetical protein
MKKNNDQRIIDAGILILKRYKSNADLRKYISRISGIAIRYSHNTERQWLLRMLALECQNRLIDRLNNIEEDQLSLTNRI